MNFIQAILLGLVQGLSEFLPISSSGHLVLFQSLFKLEENLVTFDIFLHLGTLLSILIFFRKKLISLAKDFFEGIKKQDKKSLHLIWLLIIGSIPAAIGGILLQSSIDSLFSSVKLVGINLFITALFLFIAYKTKGLTKRLDDLNWKDSLFVGLFQALALLPGISRSGSTITGSVLKKLNREDAFYFSFLLAIPAIGGAALLDLPELLAVDFQDFTKYLAGFLVSFITGLGALYLFSKIFVKNKLIYLSIYCLMIGLTILLFVSS
jgi:undecaprenyl-diphosphatase